MRPPRAATAADARDPRLRGRTYAIPFDTVWRASLKIAATQMRRWRVTEADDHDGVIHVEVNGLLSRRAEDVTIYVGLDADAQTRVDGVSAARVGGVDFGKQARRLRRFFKLLDRTVLPARSR